MRVSFFPAIIFTIIICGTNCRTAIAQGGSNAVTLQHLNGHTNLGKYLNAKKWNALFPNRYNVKNGNPVAGKKDFFSFQAFVRAAKKFPQFLNEGDEATKKRELAAFLANIAQETSGGWDAAPGGYFAWGLHYAEEQGCEKGCYQYSDTNNKQYYPVKDASYHGRGPKQLSWNYNYGQFSAAYFGDKDVLLKTPSLLSTNPVISFASAIWFWMTAQPPKPSCHDIMTGKWTPTAHDIENGRMPGFGATVNVINGGIECGNNDALPKTKYRYQYYRYFCQYFKVTPGNNIECSTQKPFNF